MPIPQNLSNGRDHLSPEERSLNMSKIRQNDTTPEILLRKMLHREGFRFRKNVERDKQNYESLSEEGWEIIIVWEGEISSRRKREKKTIELTNMLN